MVLSTKMYYLECFVPSGHLTHLTSENDTNNMENNSVTCINTGRLHLQKKNTCVNPYKDI